LAALARPEIGIVTGVGTVHLEFFDSQEGIARAKAELIEALPEDGLAVLNKDDPFTPLLASRSRAPVTTFGLGGGDFRGDDYEAGAFSVRGVEVRLPAPGRHLARNALAAIAAADHLGLPIAEAAAALQTVAVERRLQSLPSPAGFTVVDDAYNASPESMLAAFETVAELPREGRLLAVLGEMRELGAAAEEWHRRIGLAAAQVFDEVCVADVGLGHVLAQAARASLVADKPAAARWARGHAQPGDVVLVKASHGVGLEDVVAELLKG
jgi:UDP-N-acetylmuramoyl-tripeptide--D-alanyl-D-alanine ligase